MWSKRWSNISLLVVVIQYLPSFLQVVSAQLQFDNENDITGDVDRKSFVSCSCGNSQEIKERRLESAVAENIFNALVLSNQNSIEVIENLSPIRDFVDSCMRCQITYNNCTGKRNARGEFDCTHKLVDFDIYDETPNSLISGETAKTIKKRSIEEFPKLVETPVGGWKNGSTRHVRRAESCPFPSAMETAAISCKVYPSSVKCQQKCAFGYRLEKGITQDMQCLMKENKWTPAGFHECRPFVDCTMSLASPGSMKCATATLTEGPECSVECLHYEDKENVPRSFYKCSIQGDWEPPLPFCVTPGSGLVLVDTPTKKLHDE